jgi:multiple sugar transport system permease protein
MIQSRRYKIFRFVMLVLVVLFLVLPIVWMVLAAFKTNVDIYDVAKTIAFLPTLENFTKVFAQGNFGAYIINSAVVALSATGASLVLGVPAAFAMSRFVMNKSALVVLMARVIPGISLLVPWYYIFSNLRLVGSLWVLILSHMFVALPLIVYIMLGFFDGLPLEIEESGLVHGLTHIGAFWHLMVPLSRGAMATAGILSFIFSWNTFMFALVLSGSSTKTRPVAIYDFIGYASIDWGALIAASTVVTVPIMVIALFTQRYIVAGLTAGATKG